MNKKLLIALCASGVLVAALLAFFYKGSSDEFGAGYTPVTSYETRTTGYISASAATIPVSSIADKNGTTITVANISASSTPRVYFNLEPGTSREELIYCTSVAATQWAGCVRGLSFQGGSITANAATAYAHNAGSKMIMTNIGQFFTEYVSINGGQTVNDLKSFNEFPRIVTTGTLPTYGSQFASKLYVDNVGAGGFTSSNVSSTMGVVANGSSPETLGIRLHASSTRNACGNGGGGLYFDPGNGECALSIFASSTGAITLDSDGRIAFDRTASFILTGSVTSTGRFQVSTPTQDLDAANKLYVDTTFTATGTAGGTISVGNALYISTTGTLFLADPAATSTAQTFVGIASTAATVGNDVYFVKPGGVLITSGLSAGQDYYLSGTAGAITATRPSLPDLPVIIGRSLTSSRLLVKDPTIHILTTGDFTDITANQLVTMGVTPDSVKVYCGNDTSDDVSRGDWTWDRNAGTSSTQSWGVDDDALPYVAFRRNGPVCAWEEGTTVFSGYISATGTGFTFVNDWGTGRDATYIAEYNYP